MSVHIDGAECLKGRTLIVGSASSSTVSQLAAELAVSSIRLEYSGKLWSPALAPIAGADPFCRSDRLSGPADIYADPNSLYAVLLFRSPPAGKLANTFAADLAKVIKDSAVAKLVILAGSLGQEKHSIESDSFRCVQNQFLSTADKQIVEALNWIDYDPELPIHGARFARKLHSACTILQIPSLILFKYCYEGDNISDAQDMLIYLNKWLKMFDNNQIKQQLIQPPSWKHFYGMSCPISMY